MGEGLTLLVLGEYFAGSHGLGLGEGDERHGIGVHRFERERGLHLVEVVYADGEFAPLPSDSGVEFLLELHDGAECLVVDGDSFDDASHEVGSDFLHFVGDDGFHIALSEFVPLESGFESQECFESAGDSLCGVHVGPVGEEFDSDCIGTFLVLVDDSTHEGDLFENGIHGDIVSDDADQVLVTGVDHWHFLPLPSSA